MLNNLHSGALVRESGSREAREMAKMRCLAGKKPAFAGDLGQVVGSSGSVAQWIAGWLSDQAGSSLV